MATRVTGGRAGTMPGPRLAYVALVTTVFGPFWSFNTKTFQNLVSDWASPIMLALLFGIITLSEHKA